MSTDPTTSTAGPGAGAAGPSEEELRAAYEAELSRITTTDLLGQAAVSLLNIGARRLGAPSDQPGMESAGSPERDLEQVRDAVDGARALLEILERRVPAELAPLRDALSRLQMAYAREVQLPPAAAEQAPSPESGGSRTPDSGPDSARESAKGPPKPGPAEASGRLWVPGR